MKNIFSHAEIQSHCGIIDVPNYDSIENNYVEIKNFLIKQLEDKNNKYTQHNKCKHKIFSKEKIIPNQIIFFNYFDIHINIKLEQIRNTKNYETHLYYKNNKIHTCRKNYEVYFDYLIINKFKENKLFKKLFHESNGLYNVDKIIIDKSHGGTIKRPDIKIVFDNNFSFVLEFFERHHEQIDNDANYFSEKNRILQLSENENIKFGYVFNYLDVVNINKFNEKFNQLLKHCKKYNNINDEKKYCIEELMKVTDSKHFSEMLYNSHLNKNIATIEIKYVNKYIIKFKNKECKQKFINIFENFIKSLYDEKIKKQKQLETDECNDFLSDLDSDSYCGSDIDSDDNKDNLIFDKDYNSFFNEFCDGKKLTFKGLQYYINLVPPELLSSSINKSKIIDFYANITNCLLDAAHKRFNELKNISSEKKIYGL